jgi:hypothetical protein
LRAFPFQIVVDLDFPIKTTYLAVVGFRIEFGVLDVVVDEPDHVFDGSGVLLHIGDLHIGDAAAGGNGLELGFKLELAECIDGFPYIHMIGIGIVALVGDVFDGTEPFLVDPGESIAQRFCRVPYRAKPRPVLAFQSSQALRSRFITRMANSSPSGVVWLTPFMALVHSYRPM